MSEPTVPVDRPGYSSRAGPPAAAGLVGLAECSGESGATLATPATDQPADVDDFESSVVSLAGLWLATAEADDGDGADGPQYYDYDDTEPADLDERQEEATTLVDEGPLAAAMYDSPQIDDTGVDAPLNDGSEGSVDMPGGVPNSFNEAFGVCEDAHPSVTADITPVNQGQAGEDVCQPVPRATAAPYGESD